ncbi:MAG: hypothetical protein AAF988_06160 [Pseudomonadota bacterium]
MTEKINILELLFNGCAGNAEDVSARIESLTADYNDMVQIVSPDISLADRVRAHAIALDMPQSFVEGAKQAGATDEYQSDGRELFILRSLALRLGLIDGMRPEHNLEYCM